MKEAFQQEIEETEINIRIYIHVCIQDQEKNKTNQTLISKLNSNQTQSNIIKQGF